VNDVFIYLNHVAIMKAKTRIFTKTFMGDLLIHLKKALYFIPMGMLFFCASVNAQQ